MTITQKINLFFKEVFVERLFFSYNYWLAGFRTFEERAAGKRLGFTLETARGVFVHNRLGRVELCVNGVVRDEGEPRLVLVPLDEVDGKLVRHVGAVDFLVEFDLLTVLGVTLLPVPAAG